MTSNEFESGESHDAEHVSAEHIERELDEIIDAKFNPEKTPVDTIPQQLREKLQYRLMGIDVDGASIPWEKDVKHVRDLERTLVIDPEQVRREFEQIRAVRKKLEDQGELSSKDIDDAVRETSFKISSFSLEGGHVHLNTADTLYRVRREGWIILAGILDARKQFHTIATNYGLSCMPEDDEEFLLLSKSTLVAPEDDKDAMKPDRISFNWRTSIARYIDAEVLRSVGIQIPEGLSAVSTRRIGIASMLKYILARVAQLRGRDGIYFNIATLLDISPHSKEKMYNAPSFFHNRTYFSDSKAHRFDTKGYRSIRSDVVKVGHLGKRDRGAKALWKTYGDDVVDVMHNLQSEDSVLVSRGIDMAKLEDASQRIANQLQDEQN